MDELCIIKKEIVDVDKEIKKAQKCELSLLSITFTLTSLIWISLAILLDPIKQMGEYFKFCMYFTTPLTGFFIIAKRIFVQRKRLFFVQKLALDKRYYFLIAKEQLSPEALRLSQRNLYSRVSGIGDKNSSYQKTKKLFFLRKTGSILG